jgi:thiamine-phosphate pyrophosphorylase
MTPADAPQALSTSSPILCYVTDRHILADPTALIAQVTRGAAAGIDWIQIREKDMPARDLLDLASAAMSAVAGVSGSRARIIVNDRLDVALAARASGVHLGESSMPVAAVSEWRAGGGAPREFLIGASCHSLESALAAERDGADYIFFGPIFATPSKAALGAPQGLGRLMEVCSKVRIPVLAIGGVTTENARDCVSSGAAGIAAIRMFQQAQDLPALVSHFRSI